ARDPARPRGVVPGREGAVAANAVWLLSHDETRLAVNLRTDMAIDHVSAHLLERAGPADIRFLVEARLQLHEDGDLLAILDRRAECVGDGRGRTDTVERHLDGQNLRVDGGLAHEASDGVEGVVRVVHEDVAGAYGAPDVCRAFERRHWMRQ